MATAKKPRTPRKTSTTKTTPVVEETQAVQEKVTLVQDTVQEPKGMTDTQVIETILKSLEQPYDDVFTMVRNRVGDDLVKLREEVVKEDEMSQANYAVIIQTIDRYKKIG